MVNLRVKLSLGTIMQLEKIAVEKGVSWRGLASSVLHKFANK